MQKPTYDITAFLLISSLLILVLISFVMAIVYLYQKRQIAYQRNLDNIRLDYEKNILNAQLEMQEQTFQDISREIHDNIGMSLTLAKLNLNTLDIQNAKLADEKIRSSVGLLSKAIHDLTDISRSLNAEFIASYGLINAVEQEIQKLKNLGLQVNFEVTGHTVFMDSQKELIVFRIIQEALNNVLKHAKAKTITIMLFYDAAYLNASISDDGVGFTNNGISKKNGTGLINMNKRAEMIRGFWAINSCPRNGTIIKLSIPYHDNRDRQTENKSGVG